MLLEKWCWQTCWKQIPTDFQFVKNAASVKHNKVKLNKTEVCLIISLCVCIYIVGSWKTHVWITWLHVYIFFNKYTVGLLYYWISYSETYSIAPGKFHAQFIEFAGSKYACIEGRRIHWTKSSMIFYIKNWKKLEK